MNKKIGSPTVIFFLRVLLLLFFCAFFVFIFSLSFLGNVKAMWVDDDAIDAMQVPTFFPDSSLLSLPIQQDACQNSFPDPSPLSLLISTQCKSELFSWTFPFFPKAWHEETSPTNNPPTQVEDDIITPRQHYNNNVQEKCYENKNYDKNFYEINNYEKKFMIKNYFL